MIHSPARRQLTLAVVFLATYLSLEWLCYARPALAPAITPWHPQAGLMIAFLMLVGPRWWLATGLAAFLAACFIRDTQLSAVVLIAASAWIALAGVLTARSLRLVLADLHMSSTPEAAKFAGIAACAALGTAVGVIGVSIATGAVSAADFLRGVARYGLADLNGMLMVIPLLLEWDRRSGLKLVVQRRAIELLAQFLLVLVILGLIFALPDSEQLRFLYLLFVPVIWVALRWDWRGALAAVLVIQSALIFAAEADLHTPRFVDTQVLMLTLTLTALLLGSVVAERRRVEARLRERDAELSRAMRFAVAGELASATAHELNQPMTALVSYLNAAEILAQSPGQVDERLSGTVRKAAAEALRAADVLHRLRDFYIGGRSQRESVDVAKLCATVAASFIDRLARAKIVLDVIPDPALALIEADETQMHIVLHNLVANAIDAVETVNAAQKRIEIQWRGEGRDVAIAVHDSGPGIDPATTDQVFEPFVSQKPEGMGLGLAITRSLVRAHGGDVSAGASERLGGARITVRLPLAPELSP